MYRVDDIAFDEYSVETVELDLKTCDAYLRVLFSKEDKRIERRKTYRFETDCNVDVNKLIEELKNIII
jgi:hypothetical protein